MRTWRRKHLVMSTGFVVAVAAVALTLVPAAFNSNTPNGLSAFVTVTNRGPLPPCADDGSNCTAANYTWSMIRVINSNRLPNWAGGRSRDTLENAFVASSVTQTVKVNGIPQPGDFTWTVPPNLTTAFGSAGRWPSTVTCPKNDAGAFTGPPCTVVGSPAVIPGEAAVVFFAGWFHSVTELKGTYVIIFTIRGTLNGNPVVLTASTPPISMT